MATNFLETAGTNGFIVSPVTVMTTELNSWTTSFTATSSSSFNQSSWGNSMWGVAQLILGSSITWSTSTRSSASGWFLYSPDGGTTYEVTTPLRSPDFFLPPPLSGSSTSSSLVSISNIFRIPWCTTKIFISTPSSGIPSSASGNSLKICAVTIRY